MNLSCPYDTTTQPVASGTVHSKGCYGDDQFVFPEKNGQLTLDTTKMTEGETYVVFVIITKGERVAENYQAVEIIQGDPPVSNIE